MPRLCAGTLSEKCAFRRGSSKLPAQSRPNSGTCAWRGARPEQKNMTPQHIGPLRRAIKLLTGETRENAFRRIPWISNDAVAVASIGRNSMRSQGSAAKTVAGSAASQSSQPRASKMCIGREDDPCVFRVSMSGGPTRRRQKAGKATCI